MRKLTCTPIALTIAGSDCSGGAGLEADLKTFNSHGVYGMAAVTCVVAENPKKVVSIYPLPSRVIQEQIECCLQGMTRVAIKTGMLFSPSIIQKVYEMFACFRPRISWIIIDPVMVATSGKRLLPIKGIPILKKLIKDYATLLTPNLDEAELLANQKIRSTSEMEIAAKTISNQFSCAVLLKGGHLDNPLFALDFFWDGKQGHWLKSHRIKNIQTHGTGCTYSAAITAHLALGYSLLNSIQRSKQFVTHAIQMTYRFKPWMALNHFPGKKTSKKKEKLFGKQ